MVHHLQANIPGLIEAEGKSSVAEFLFSLTDRFPDNVVFSTSFTIEDQLITDILRRNPLPISIFSLDTGRMFSETYSTWSRTNEKYETFIRAFYPDRDFL